eukprot:TCALIF_02699-PA protein Name:"Similar to ANK3 Ankyrin-3 (Homo sapiens)" AED:0.10 eAED:0.10 QI:0/0.77/0.6/0.9/0.55/0.8/10/151/968
MDKLASKNDVGALNALDARGRTPLHLAATLGHPEIVGTLLTHGATVHSRDVEGASPLHRAVQKGHDAVARTLLDRGAPLDGVDLKGDTVLHWAVRQGQQDLVALILRKGANPDISNKAQECPLHEAIRLGQCDTALLLLRCGASVNVSGPQAVTPLMLACTRPDTFTLVETLLDYEADPKALDQKGRDAIWYAKGAGQNRLVNLLQRFVNSQDAAGSMEDSFDEDDEFEGKPHPIGGEAANPLRLPMDPGVQPPLPLAMGTSTRASVRSDAQGVPISDLSSWGSNSSPSIEPEPSKIKHSQGIMDLSKFLNSEDDTPQAVSKQDYLDIKEASCRKENLNNALKEKFQRDKEQLQQTVGTLESQIAHLKNQHQIETDKLQNEILTLEKDIAESRNIIQHVEQDKQDLKAIHEDLELKLRKAENENKIEVELLNKTLESLRAKSSNLSDERFTLLSKERLQLEKDLSDALVDNEAMRKKLAELNELIKQRAVDESHTRELLNSELVKTKGELTRLANSLDSKEKELSQVKRSLNQSTNEELLDKRKQLSNLESDKLDVDMQLKFAQQKVITYESHVEHLNERINRLEEDFESVKEEKKAILGKLKKKEAEMEQINLQVVEHLKSQLKLEARKLEKEREKVETLEQKQKDLERSSQRTQNHLDEVNRDLNHAAQEKKSLKDEINSVYEKIHVLETKLDEEKRKFSHSSTQIAQLQDLVNDQRSKTESSDRRIKQLTQEIQGENAKRREVEFKLEQNRSENGEDKTSNQVVIESLEDEMELLKKQNTNLAKKFEEASKKLVTVDSLNKKVKLVNTELQKKNKLIEDLEERLANIHEHEASSYQKEVRKFKLKYEIMARNELNQKLAEINAFLEDRAKEQSQNEKTKDEVMQNIQKDLGERLTQSKDELSGIKSQMKETERGIKQLQSQLHQREQELLLERSLRKQLEKQLGSPNELSHFKVNPFNEKPFIYL